MPNATTLPEVEIFRAGTHVDASGAKHTITTADLAAVAAAYNPQLGEAPLVVGHPQQNGPAYGWVDRLTVRGDLLVATPHQVDADFAALVNKGTFKKRSASFFLPDSPGNPKPGQMYLRHVGFLGAAAPAVAGLRDVQFAADTKGVIEFSLNDRRWGFGYIADLFRSLRERLIETDGIEKADQLLPSWRINSIQEAATPDSETPVPSFNAPETDMTQQNADFAARETALATRATEMDAREARMREREDAARRTEVADFAAGLVKQGRLLPKDSPMIMELLFSLGGGTPTTLNFSAADGTAVKQAPDAALRAFLAAQPVQVDFSERSGAGGDGAAVTEFSAPNDTTVNAERLAMHNKALAYQRQNAGTSYIDAVRAVGG